MNEDIKVGDIVYWCPEYEYKKIMVGTLEPWRRGYGVVKETFKRVVVVSYPKSPDSYIFIKEVRKVLIE